MAKYTIGVDFGTESGRVVLVDTGAGRIMATHVTAYPHGVLDERLPTGEQLGAEWALQHPEDYWTVIRESIAQVLQSSGINGADIVGIGVDFTSCTMLPIDREGIPLCTQNRFQRRPHSWPKLWKHHAAKREAQRVTELAMEWEEPLLRRYGGSISAEWMIPKVLQVLREDPEIYAAADRFVEAGDWFVFCLTGRLVRNVGGAGFKSMWSDATGFPSTDYFKALHPDFEHVVRSKLKGPIVPVGSKVGGLTAAAALATGLRPGTAVAAAVIDAFAAMPGLGVTKPGTMVMAMGTSTCHMVLAATEQFVEGMTGVVRDGMVPGYYGYEAGQAAVGDMFAWFVENGVPSQVMAAAKREGVSVHQWLEEHASQFQPGENGLLALDWWNGNRSVLADANLSGLIVGLTLDTTPAEIYRSLIEATAFGTRRIIEQFERSGISVEHLFAGGGLTKRNRLLMQIYADVTGRVIHVPASDEATALGAAMFGAVAAGKSCGGHDTLSAAAKHMADTDEVVYHPIPVNVAVYQRLYDAYCQLHDDFGRGPNLLMHTLRDLRAVAQQRSIRKEGALE